MGYINEAMFVEYINHINDKLFTAIIYNNADEIDRLKANGETLSETVEKAITESVSDDIWFEYCYISSNLSDEDFMRVMSELALAVGEDKKLHFTDWFFHVNEKRFFDPKQLGFILDHFNQSKINKTRLMKAFIDRDNVPCLKLVVERGWIKQPKKRDEMIQYAVENEKTECTAFLMDFKNRTADFAAEREKAEKKMQCELNADPNSVTELKKIWGFDKQDDGTLIITSYKGNRTEITVPEKIGKDTVTAIGKYAFSTCAPRIRSARGELRESITKITLPDTVKRIESHAFYACKSLKEINIPEGITEIKTATFAMCLVLKSLKIPDSVTKIGEHSFDCCGMEEFNIPNRVTEIGEYAFSNCVSIKSLEIPDSVKQIGQYAFFRCQSLKKIKLPREITEIGASMLQNCFMLESIEIPNTVETIGEYAFYDCDSLERVELPNSVKKIAGNAFGRCGNLKTIILPPSVKQIKNQTESGEKPETIFDYSPNVTAIVEPKSYAEGYCKRNEIPYKYKED